MKYNRLGNTNIFVSHLCFGSLTISPLQKSFSLEKGTALIEAALDLGINFIDTAEMYDTYPFIHQALKIKPDLVISTKSYSYDKKTAENSFYKAIREIGREYIDIFMLHEQESIHTLRGHWEAIEYFIDLKRKGYIGAFGISTHRVSGVRDAAKFKEIDVIHPIINEKGIGILDGTREDMENAISYAHEKGIGIFAMKPLGGGHLIPQRETALDYILSLPFVDSVAVGMQSIYEIEYNVKYFNDIAIDKSLLNKLGNQKRVLFVHDWCQGCGRCIKACKNSALSIKDGKVFIDQNKCYLCGYCANQCPDFCLKVI